MSESGFLYVESAEGLTAEALTPFCSEWSVRPTADLLLNAVRGSACVIWARAGEAGPAVGLVTAVSDGALTAHISLLEVLPAWRGAGLGTELVRRCLARLRGHYAVDLICDEGVVGFYTRLGLIRGTAMMLRDHGALEANPGEPQPPGALV